MSKSTGPPEGNVQANTANLRPRIVLNGVREADSSINQLLAASGVERSAGTRRQERRRQLDDNILPPYRSLGAPLLAIVGGSTGFGKSTLVNGLVAHPVTRSGNIRWKFVGSNLLRGR